MCSRKWSVPIVKKPSAPPTGPSSSKKKLGGMTGKSSTELSANVAQAAKMRSLVGKEQEQPRRSDSPQCQYEMRRAHDERRSLANPHDMGGDDTVAS